MWQIWEIKWKAFDKKRVCLLHLLLLLLPWNLYVTQELFFLHRWIFRSHDAHNSITQINHLLKGDGSNKGATASAKKSMISIKGRGSDTFRWKFPNVNKKALHSAESCLFDYIAKKGTLQRTFSMSRRKVNKCLDGYLDIDAILLLSIFLLQLTHTTHRNRIYLHEWFLREVWLKNFASHTRMIWFSRVIFHVKLFEKIFLVT